jgi:hypothetical protein
MKLIRCILSALLLIAVMPVMALNTKTAELDANAYKLLAIVNGCDMDDLCILGMLKELVKTDPNPLYKKYLQIADSYKAEVENNIKICRTAQTMAYKKELAKCMAAELKKPGVIGFSQNKIENEMGECLTKSMTPLATENNMYAQASLAQNALTKNDNKQHEYWMTMLRGQLKSPESGVFDKCGSGLALPLKIMLETIKAAAKDKGIKID